MSAMNARTLPVALCLAVGIASAACSADRDGEPVRTVPAGQTTFERPEEASEALILAAENGDMAAMAEIFGPDGIDLVVTGEPVHDENVVKEFAEVARERSRVVRDPETPDVATVLVGPEDWPLPIPIVEKGGRWWFDTAAGREEILYRRIGENELDAVEVCRGYVEAQLEYARDKRGGARVNQYAQRIISTPGKQDGLAWRTEDGTWEGPVGEAIAGVIAEGYTKERRYEPYHGYYFKVLTGQGPAARLGEMDFLVGGIMIGGFALAASPVDYAVTGVMTFIVSHDGVVYEKDLGPSTLDEFHAMERYNPDSSWNPVVDP